MSRKQFKSPGTEEFEVLIWFINNPNKWVTITNIAESIGPLTYSQILRACNKLRGIYLQRDEHQKEWMLDTTKGTRQDPAIMNKNKIEYSPRGRAAYLFDYFIMNLPLYLRHARKEIESGNVSPIIVED